jgi:release factor glutamine methyltransferase
MARLSTLVQSAAEALHAAQQLLGSAAIEDARLEAEVLLMHALGIDRERLYARLQEPLPVDARETFEGLLQQRLAHEPAAYITGHKEFYGLDLSCTPDALIPRPETELPVELAVARLRREEQGTRNKEQGHPPPQMRVAGRGSRVADVGTGGGAIAIAIAVGAPDAHVVAIDPSRAALVLARENAMRHGVAERVDFVQGSLLEALRGRVDVIVANLPYISTAEYESLPPEIREHEPEMALHAGTSGTELIDALLAQAPALLNRPGLLLAEHAWDQGTALRETAGRAFPNAHIETKQDLAGLDRVLVVEMQ